MRVALIVIWIGLVCILPFTVKAQKKQVRQGLAQEQAGDLLAAVSSYKAALYKNQYHTEASAALERCANKLVSNWLGDYFLAREAGDWQEVEAISQRIDQLQEEMQYFAIDLPLPDYQRSRLQQDALQIPAARLEAIKMMHAAGQPTQATEQLEQLLAQYPNYQPAYAFQDSLFSESVIREAAQAMQRGSYLLAYDHYTSLASRQPAHPDYSRLRNMAKEKGTLRLGVFDLSVLQPRFSAALQSGMTTAIVNWAHPLVEVLERGELDVLLEEQRQVLSGLYDERQAPRPGMLQGLHQVLLLRLEGLEYRRPGSTSYTATAYLEQHCRVYDEQGNWRNDRSYQPVDYTVYQAEASMTASLHYKLVDVETGRLLLAGKVAHSLQDSIRHHRVRDYDPAVLLPSTQGEIILSGEQVSAFRAAFKQSGALGSEAELLLELEQQLISKAMARLRQQILSLQL